MRSRPAKTCRREKDSPRNTAPVKTTHTGARKVRTVASDSDRCRSERYSPDRPMNLESFPHSIIMPNATGYVFCAYPEDPLSNSNDLTPFGPRNGSCTPVTILRIG
jgi:hypothetical protein